MDTPTPTINILGSNLTSNNNINLISGSGSINILNTLDISYSQKEHTKKNMFKKIKTTSTDYIETSIGSSIDSNNGNINIISNNNILIQGSNLDSKNNNTNLQAENTIDIIDAITHEYHNITKEKTNRGMYKGLTSITSAITDVALLGTNLFLSIAAPIYENSVINPIKKLLQSNNSDILNNLNYKDLKRKEKDLIYNNSLHNNNIKNTNEQSNTKIVSSNIKTEKDLTITSNNTINIKTSNLISNNGNININANTLNILSDETQTSKTTDKTTKSTFINKHRTNGDIAYNIEDTNIIVNNRNTNNGINKNTNNDNTNNNNAKNNNNITFNVKDKLNIQTSEKEKNKVIDYINYLNNNTNTNNTNSNNPSITQSILKTNNEHINNTTRQITDIAQISVATAAITLSIITGGIGSGVSGAMMTASSTTAGTIAANTAIQTSLNTNGDIFKQIKGIINETIKETTSEDSLKSVAIAAGMAGLSRWVVDKTGVEPSLKTGTAESSKTGINTVVGKDGKIYLEGYLDVADKEVTGFNKMLYDSKILSPYDNNSVFKILNTKIPGFKTFTEFHDVSMDVLNVDSTLLKMISIPPWIVTSYCASAPGLCFIFTTNEINNMTK